jgi:outer membrane receptor protein involved in Fe transport
LSAVLKGSYYNQRGDFERLDAPSGFFIHGDDQFWLFDTAVSYRLPKRTGSITVGAKNLFDKSFQFADTDPNNPSIQPKRFLYARATLAF